MSLIFYHLMFNHVDKKYIISKQTVHIIIFYISCDKYLRRLVPVLQSRIVYLCMYIVQTVVRLDRVNTFHCYIILFEYFRKKNSFYVIKSKKVTNITTDYRNI